LATGLNLIEVRANGMLATALTLGKIGLVLVIAVGAYLLADGNWDNYTLTDAAGTCQGVEPESRGGLAGFAAAMLGALWAYNGWAGVVSLGGEVKRPGWTLPRALIGGTVLVMILYLLINAAYFYVLTPTEIASVSEDSTVAFEVAQRFMGPATSAVLSACLMVSAYGTLHSGSLFSSRIPYAIARGGMLPSVLGRLSAYGVPFVSVIGLGLWSSTLTLTGKFDVLTDMYIFLLWVFYGLIGSTVFVLRRRMPHANRPYRVWGYPVVPAVFLLVTAFLLINTMITSPLRSLAGLGLIAIGMPVYWHYNRKLGPAATRDWSDGEVEPNGSAS
jgi:APA family basic amino acid/polyamine antiporter